ncbi:MAG: PAS domain-containing protein [Cyanobacteria bacterium J06649_4]
MSMFWLDTLPETLLKSLSVASSWGLAFLLYRLTHRRLNQEPGQTSSQASSQTLSPKQTKQNAPANQSDTNHFNSGVQQPTHAPELPDFIFQQAIEHAAGGLVICDARSPDFPIVYVSPSFETLTGYQSAEVIGKNCRFLQGQETNQLGTEDIRQALAKGTSCKVLIHNYRKNGQPFWNELTISPLINPEGIITHYVGAMIDISHYLDTFKALQQSEARYRHLYDELATK